MDSSPAAPSVESSSPPASLAPDEVDGRVPLVIGVTGHRTLEDRETLRRLVVDRMQTLKKRYPHTPFVVLSPLAEGADRLVARAALEHLEARLFVPLPLPEEEYRTDFEGPEAQDEFDALLGQAERVIELPLQASRSAVRSGEARAFQYARAGAFVVDRSQVLFALWDGEPARGTGGTGEVVQWARQGRVPQRFLPPESQDRPFYYPNETQCIHVHTEQQSVEVLEDSHGALHPTLTRIDQHNSEASALPSDAVEQSLSYVMGEADVYQRPPVARLLARYARADARAGRLQRRFHHRLRGIYVLSALAIISFAGVELWAWAIAGSLAFVGAALGVLYWTRSQDLENRFLNARALAEGLRVATFWTVGGLPDHVHDHYFNKYVGDLAWTRLALQNIETVSRTGIPPDQLPADADEVRAGWVDDQCAYFARQKEEAANDAGWYDGLAQVAFGGTMVYALGLMIYFAFGPSVSGNTVELLAVGVELLLAFGVSWKAYKSKLGLDALQRHYATAHTLFRAAQGALDRGEAAPDDILVQLGEEALLENGEWLWLNQTRDIDTPTLA